MEKLGAKKSPFCNLWIEINQMSDEWSDRRRESVAGKFIVDVQGISWQEFKDESGNIFYYNIATAESSWSEPVTKSTTSTTSSVSSSVYTTTEENTELTATDLPVNHAVSIDSSVSHKKKRPKRKKLDKKLSINTFRLQGKNNRCQSYSVCIAMFASLIFIIVVIITGSNSQPQVVLGIPWEDVSTWTLVLIGLFVAFMFVVIIFGCICFRFQICESWSICQVGSSPTILSHIDIEYEKHLKNAKSHLKEQNDLSSDSNGNSSNHLERRKSLKYNDENGKSLKFEDNAESNAHRESAKRKRQNRGKMGHHHQHHSHHADEENQHTIDPHKLSQKKKHGSSVRSLHSSH